MSNSVIDQFTRALEACQERAENAERERDELADNIGNQAAEQQEVAETLAYERDQYRKQRDALLNAARDLIAHWKGNLAPWLNKLSEVVDAVDEARAVLDGGN